METLIRRLHFVKVEAAKRHWAKTSVGCEKEASRLAAVTRANAEELQLAKSYVSDAEGALATLEAQMATKRRRAAARGANSGSQSHADYSDGSSEEEAATEAGLLTPCGDAHVSDRTAQQPMAAKQRTSIQAQFTGQSVIVVPSNANALGQAPARARTLGTFSGCRPELVGQPPRISAQLAPGGMTTGGSATKPAIVSPHLTAAGSHSSHASGQSHTPESSRVQAQIWQNAMRQFMLQQAEAAPTSGDRPPPGWQPAAPLGAGAKSSSASNSTPNVSSGQCTWKICNWELEPQCRRGSALSQHLSAGSSRQPNGASRAAAER